MLGSGQFQIDVPEEAALLVVTYLLDHGLRDEALELLDELHPLHDRLRFYPASSSEPVSLSDRVHLQSVGEVSADLSNVRDKDAISVQNETLNVWIPLYDRFVDLMLETVDGDPPSFARDGDGEPLAISHPRGTVLGGTPCRRLTDDWRRRATDLLAEYGRLRRRHVRSGKPERRGENFCDLRTFTAKCCDADSSLTDREIDRVRLILARDAAKRGMVGSTERRELRSAQTRVGRLPTNRQFAQLLVRRMGSIDVHRGADDLTAITSDVNANEAELWSLPVATPIPEALEAKVARCMEATVDELVERGVITSADVLAKLLPQISSGVQARDFADPQLRRVFSATYLAFRRRRSLLLLNLENQVQFAELPWVAAMNRFRTSKQSNQQASLQTLIEISRLTLKSFPYAIVPNKLLQEMRALVKSAKLVLPLVDEIAADIFMGQFSGKFLDAARIARSQLGGTLYETYYRLDADALPGFAGREKHVAGGFAELCARRAGVTLGGWNAASNGRVIEQQQILTTQNLAALFTLPGLKESLATEFSEMASDCFRWICTRLQANSADYHSKLIATKNAAYAWRQMVYFLSQMEAAELPVWLQWCREHLQNQNAEFARRFRPAVNGLEAAHQGSGEPHVAVPFLGWSTGKHWLLTSD